MRYTCGSPGVLSPSIIHAWYHTAATTTKKPLKSVFFVVVEFDLPWTTAGRRSRQGVWGVEAVGTENFSFIRGLPRDICSLVTYAESWTSLNQQRFRSAVFEEVLAPLKLIAKLQLLTLEPPPRTAIATQVNKHRLSWARPHTLNLRERVSGNSNNNNTRNEIELSVSVFIFLLLRLWKWMRSMHASSHHPVAVRMFSFRSHLGRRRWRRLAGGWTDA